MELIEHNGTFYLSDKYERTCTEVEQCEECDNWIEQDDIREWRGRLLCDDCIPKCDAAGCDRHAHPDSEFDCCAEHTAEAYHESAKGGVKWIKGAKQVPMSSEEFCRELATAAKWFGIAKKERMVA